MQDKIKIFNDILLDIATGTSRKDKHWKNKKILWSELLKKLSKTHYTAETGPEYDAATLDRQAEIKDIGGFVGGLLTGGRRLGSAVMHRSLLTLDVDNAPLGFWDDFKMIFDFAACVYSTHKHRAEKPRLRLLLPLDRTADPCQYEAAARWLAGQMNIEAFDDTGFQPSRLMYWPSTSAGQPYEFSWQDGPIISLQWILDHYADYTDSSQWPVSVKVNKKIARDIKKQGDPLEKPGIIGAWCRCYDIDSVIENYLPDIYEKCEVDGRYTYVNGSTSAGLVVYDGKFAYSHHGTDPVSGKLCNAFDLVRIHLFGDLDKDETLINGKLPSFNAMLDLIEKDKAVRVQRGEEKLAEAFREFGEDPLDEITEKLFNVETTDLKFLGIPVIKEVKRSDEWLKDLEYEKKSNQCKPTTNNVLLILRNDPLLKGKLAFNDFESFPVVLGGLPWQKLNDDNPRGRFWTDQDDSGLRHYLETAFGISSAAKIKDARNIVFFENRFHPIRNYLNGLVWDGEKRLDRCLVDYFGADDNAYIRAVTRKWFVAGVARIFEPGVKFDNVLVLVGPEEIYKSTFYRTLSYPWFSDNFSFHLIGKKDAVEQLTGAWIIEIAELTGLKKTEQEAIKSFVARQEDTMRWAYKEWLTKKLRQFIFGGSTNIFDFLQGATGNRRFWAVETRIDEATKSIVKDLPDERGQLWAEALQYYRDGESLYLSDELKKQAKDVAELHTEQDPRFARIQRYLDEPITEDWDRLTVFEKRGKLNDELTQERKITRNKITVEEIWTVCLECQIRDMNTHSTKPVHDMMRKIEGWEYRRIKVNGQVYRGYVRK